MSKLNKIIVAIAIICLIFIWYLIIRPTAIERLYKVKANVVEMRLEQEAIRNTAQAKIDTYNEQIQIIDTKLFDAINGTTTIISTGGLEQGTLSAQQTGVSQ